MGRQLWYKWDIFYPTFSHEGWKVSERVAILDAIEKKAVGDNQYNGSQDFVTHKEATKKAGFGNEETARQATKVVHEGAPELIEAGDKVLV